MVDAYYLVVIVLGFEEESVSFRHQGKVGAVPQSHLPPIQGTNRHLGPSLTSPFHHQAHGGASFTADGDSPHPLALILLK